MRARDHHAHGRYAVRLACCAIFILMLLVAACREDEPRVEPALSVRPVRVLLFDDAPTLRVRIDSPYTIKDASGEVLQAGEALGWTTISADAGIHIGPEQVSAESVTIDRRAYGAIRVAVGEDDERHYFGALRLAATNDNTIQAINLVDVESYVAGVVPNEAWPNFHDEALRAQAVVARTYLLYQMTARGLRDYDVRASEGDQVYRGARNDRFGRRVAEAVHFTRGIVAAWNVPEKGLRIFPTYYSAACGGSTQSATAIQTEEVPLPLCGGVTCDECRIAPGEAYRWGPAEMSLDDLLERLKARESETADWKRIDRVEVLSRNDAGRIAEVRIDGSDGKQVTMSGERFRLTVGSRVMRSSHCNLATSGGKLHLTDGRGFGHGVGLCQWGMEARARAGTSAADIIRHYYPGVRLVRAY